MHPLVLPPLAPLRPLMCLELRAAGSHMWSILNPGDSFPEE